MKTTSRTVAKSLYMSSIYIFFYLPIAVLIAYSFNESQFSLVWHKFSWQWYQQLFADNDLWSATLNSFFIGMVAATLATFIGVLAATSLYRYQFLGKNVLHGLIFVLIAAPDIVLGTALFILFNTLKFPLGFWSLLLAHITFCIPFATVTIYSRATSIDKNVFEAAKDLGATDWTIFFRVILPLLAPSLVAAWLLSFTLSLDDAIISYFVTGPDFQILPLTIYSLVRIGINPEINALCTILFGVTLLLVTISQLALRKKP
jgi:spermidine/putrescine transport system permease protein